MAAKMRDVDPVKFSNARSSLPYDAYEKIAHLMAIEDDPLLHVMFVWQWNCIARVANIQTVSFNHMEWVDDHLSTRWSKSKKDQEGKRSFNIAIMANRYDWKLCPITALAIWLSCNTITGNALFPGSSQNKRYSDNLKRYLNREDIKSKLQEFADLLLGTHSSRKGATNHAAQSGLCADVLIAVLLRGQWDIGNTWIFFIFTCRYICLYKNKKTLPSVCMLLQHVPSVHM